MLREIAMLRRTTHVSSSCPTPDPGSYEAYNLPLSYLGGVAGLSLQGSSGAGQYFQVLQVHLLGLAREVADVVRKANNMHHDHRCACICGSMKAYRSGSASNIHG